MHPTWLESRNNELVAERQNGAAQSMAAVATAVIRNAVSLERKDVRR